MSIKQISTKVLVALALLPLFANAQELVRLRANADHVSIFMVDASKGTALKNYWRPDGVGSYYLYISDSITAKNINTVPAWKNTIGSNYKDISLVPSMTPYFRFHGEANNPRENLAFIKRITRTCIPESKWFAGEPVISSQLKDENSFAYGRVVGYFPDANKSYTSQGDEEVYLGIFLKYEYREGQLGFWVLSSEQKKIRKHFVFGTSNYSKRDNAKNWCFVMSELCI